MKTITEKIMEKAIMLCNQAEMDERLHGDNYVEFGERSIRILDPTKIKIKLDKKAGIKELIYGKSVIQAISEKRENLKCSKK